jgi:hypothetical protein
MPLNDAAMFLSQDAITRALKEFEKSNLKKYTTLESVINKWLNTYRKNNHIDDSSPINSEGITRQELIEGMSSRRHDSIDYKVLSTFLKLKTIADAVRKLTFVTRFNSISSSVGPLILDNLILEHKEEQFTESDNRSTYFYKLQDGEYKSVDINDVLEMHPILREFEQTVGIAASIFHNMPANSQGFRNILNSLKKMQDTVYNDKSLMDKLLNFYQSYMLLKSGFVDENKLRYYIEDFPKEFEREEIKKKYPNNALIQAINMNTSKKSGRTFLKINITGLDESAKEMYRNAWTDLHKSDPELSKKLFDYCFFRAGIGFSPKTFMSLVPTYVKEHMTVTTPTGFTISYVDVFRNLPQVPTELVIDQWVRNNWKNGKLVSEKENQFNIDEKSKSITIKRNDTETLEDLKNVEYMITKNGNEPRMWRRTVNDQYGMVYVEVTPLGDNAEYLEMSTQQIKKPMSNTDLSITDFDVEDITEIEETDPASDFENIDLTLSENESVDTDTFITLMRKQVPGLSNTDALNRLEKMRDNPKMYLKFIQNILKQGNLELNEQKALEFFEKIC